MKTSWDLFISSSACEKIEYKERIKFLEINRWVIDIGTNDFIDLGEFISHAPLNKFTPLHVRFNYEINLINKENIKQLRKHIKQAKKKNIVFIINASDLDNKENLEKFIYIPSFIQKSSSLSPEIISFAQESRIIQNTEQKSCFTMFSFDPKKYQNKNYKQLKDNCLQLLYEDKKFKVIQRKTITTQEEIDEKSEQPEECNDSVKIDWCNFYKQVTQKKLIILYIENSIITECATPFTQLLNQAKEKDIWVITDCEKSGERIQELKNMSTLEAPINLVLGNTIHITYSTQEIEKFIKSIRLPSSHTKLPILTILDTNSLEYRDASYDYLKENYALHLIYDDKNKRFCVASKENITTNQGLKKTYSYINTTQWKDFYDLADQDKFIALYLSSDISSIKTDKLIDFLKSITKKIWIFTDICSSSTGFTPQKLLNDNEELKNYTNAIE